MSSPGSDLAVIRKQQDLSLEDIHDMTKIPLHFLQAIEDDSIFTDFEENKTYVRSYIRSYGRALKLDDDLVVTALDKFEAGNYSGQLLSGHTKEKSPEESTRKEMDAETAEPPPESQTGAEEPSRRPKKHLLDHNINRERVPNPPSISSVDWAGMGRKFTPLQTKSRMWIGIVIILLLVGAVIFFWYYQNNLSLLQTGFENPSPQQGLSQPAVVPDSLQLRLADPESGTITTESAEPQTLGDTLFLQIYAAYGNLEPVRVYSDVMDDTNPYWIEEREAVEFEFTEHIYLRGQYSRMELLFNGHPIENFRQRFFDPDSNMVLIPRSLFEGDDLWLQPAPDSTQLGFSLPLVVRERPTFN